MGSWHSRYVLAGVALWGLFACTQRAAQDGAGGMSRQEALIDSMFNCRLPIPEGMNSWKVGQNFIWLSDDEAATMRNICIYSYPGRGLDEADVARMRDSVMWQNLPGEAPGMYMQTEKRVPLRFSRVEWHGQKFLRTAGQWEMEGDAMGGPFVSHSREDSVSRRIVVAEAFVFAPGRSKTDVMRSLEKQLLKLEFNDKNKK